MRSRPDALFEMHLDAERSLQLLILNEELLEGSCVSNAKTFRAITRLGCPETSCTSRATLMRSRPGNLFEMHRALQLLILNEDLLEGSCVSNAKTFPAITRLGCPETSCASRATLMRSRPGNLVMRRDRCSY